MNQPVITTIRGVLPGPTLAVFAAVHGNEKVGQLAFKQLLPGLRLQRGTVHFVIANPLALERGVRFVEANLNRRFVPDNDGSTVEDDLARTLMPLLDQCDALLDLHSGNEPGLEPFVICEELSLPLARTLGVGIISTGWKHFEEGATDSYMDAAGKLAVCLECGSSDTPERFTEFAVENLRRFLSYFGCLEGPTPSPVPARTITITDALIMPEGGLTFSREYHTFEHLEPGAVYARSGTREYRAPKNSCIIFPRPHNPVGSEACLIGAIDAENLLP